MWCGTHTPSSWRCSLPRGRKRNVSADRLSPPKGIAELIENAERIGWEKARAHFANVAARYPLDHFTYDERSHSDVLRLKDTISEAIFKNAPIGEMIR